MLLVGAASDAPTGGPASANGTETNSGACSWQTVLRAVSESQFLEDVQNNSDFSG